MKMTQPRPLPRGPPPSPAPTTFQPPFLNGFDVHEITLADLQWHFAQNHFSPSEYASYCLERIRVLNPYLEAVIETNPDAVSLAAAAHRGSLHGIPVLIKDNIAVADKMHTTAGSLALLSSRPAADADVVAHLRDAGAVPLGRTNMSEWASLRSKTHSAGFSPRGGQTRNPYDLAKSPFSSSSGSAVAVAAGMAPVALGTETDTSVIGPASVNGVVGIKPGVGVTSREGVVPISGKMDSVGCFGRTVADAVAVLDVIAGLAGEGRYGKWVSGSEALRGARFGLPVKRCWEMVEPSCKAVAERVMDAMRKAGAEVFEVELPSAEERVGKSGTWDWERGAPEKSEWTVAKVDAYNDMTKYLQGLQTSEVRTVEGVVDFNERNDGAEGAKPGTLPAYPNGQDNLLEMVESKGVEDETYRSALRHIRKQTRENGIDAALVYTDPNNGDKIELDALLFCDRKGIGQQYAAQAGYPIICIPIGLDKDGIPVSLSFQHSAQKEEELVKWASAVEHLWNRENGWRPLPTFRNFGAKNIPIGRIDD